MPIPDTHSEPHAWLALHLIAGVGPAHLRALLAAFGSPQQVLNQSAASLARAVPQRCADAIRAGADSAQIAAALRWLDAEHNHLITLADADYPRPLLEITDPPPVLFLKGRRALLQSPAFAVVGSRNATPQGMQNAEAFAAVISAAGMCVISGLALGIDTAAHRGGLAGPSSSIAVVGTGLDLVYPARNKALAHELAERGAILSEFALGTPALAANFPRRNRLISGLSRGCLVVEAALASGSLITARMAVEQGREVFAIPGSIHSPFAKGCHQLIKQGAKLVESAEDILEELGLQTRTPVAVAAPVDRPDDPLLSAMGFDPVGFDALVGHTGAAVDVLTAKLTEWEISGLVAALPGGKYQRLK